MRRSFAISILLVSLAGPILADAACPLITTTILNFDSVSPPPGGGYLDAANYLAGYGVTFTSLTPNGDAVIFQPGAATPTSLPNAFSINVPGLGPGAVAYRLNFCAPLTSVSFSRIAIAPQSGIPAWTVTALNAQGQTVASFSENFQVGPAARTVTLTGSGITAIEIAGQNDVNRTTFNAPPIDDLALTPAAPAVCPLTSTTILNFDSVTPPPGGGYLDATNYLAGYGVTFTSFTPNGEAVIFQPGAATPTSLPNAFSINVPGLGPADVSYQLNFCAPLAKVSFSRIAIAPQSGIPLWTVTAINAQGQAVASFSEDFQVGPAARTVTLAGPGITAIQIAGRNDVDRTTFNVPPIDDLTLTPVTVPGRFVPVHPCRVVDTRNANGPFGGPKLPGGSTRDFAIPNNSCGIPTTASAYSLNVTVVPDGQLGFLTAWPTGQPKPLVSVLNSDGRIKANAAIVPAGAAGSVSVFVTDPTHLVIDINGYFEPANTSGAELQFYPLTPCRIADTRQAPGPFGGPFLSGGASGRSFPVLSSACGVPAAVRAYSLNLTAVPHGPLGFITLWPSGEGQPLVSTLNASTGAITANAAIVPTGIQGGISIYASNDTDIVIDINGYFAAPGAGGLDLFTVPPCRVLDTRNSPGSAPISFLAINIASNACMPPGNGARAFVLNATVVPPVPLGFLTLWPDAEAQPLVSTLNSSDGAIVSNMAIVPTMNGSIDAFASDATQLIIDVFGYFAP